MANSTHGSLAEDAAAHLRRSGHSVQSIGGNPGEIDRQSVSIVAWARSKGLILTDAYTAGLKKHHGTTAEHEVFYRETDDRAVKLTYAGTFGVTPGPKRQQIAATPLFYLLRIKLMNQVFSSDIRLEGILLAASLIIGASGEHPRMIVSQPWIRAKNPRFPHPTALEIEQFMKALDFTQTKGSYFGWSREKDRVVIIDARPDNFIDSHHGVVPIDLVVNQPD